MNQILAQSKYEEEMKKQRLKQQQEAMDAKIKFEQEERKKALKIKIEQDKAEAIRKKIIFKTINKEREEMKKKLIEDKIEVKEASVKKV